LAIRDKRAELGEREETYSFMFELFQPTHLLFVLLVALVVLGPKRLGQTSRSIGRTIRSIQEYKDEFNEGLLGMAGEDEPDEKRSKEKERPDKRAVKEKESEQRREG
jgi:Sec-independent protein translocase protein TatA